MPRVPSKINTQPTAVKSSVLQKQGAFPLEQTGTRAGNQTQQNARATSAQARANPFADGNLIEGVSFTNGATTIVVHKLGRAFRGYFLVNQRFPASAGVAVVLQTANADPRLDAHQISIFSDGTFVSDVWVY